MWLIRTRSGARRLLTAKLDWWQWSPRAGRIAYSTYSSEVAHLFVATPTGRSRLVAVGKGLLDNWSPNGRWLGYSASGRLTIVHGDGSRPRVIAHPGGFINFSWSPDSRALLYLARTPQQVNDNTPIVIVNRNGKNRRTIAAGYGAGWSPDGRWIWFYAHSATNWRDIDIVRPNGSDMRTLGSGCFFPSWAPHGKWLAFAFAGCGTVLGDLRMWVVEAKTGATLFEDRGQPLWAPEGQRLAIIRYGEPPLTLVDADGTNRVDVQGVTATDAAWSPSGKSLAFGSSDRRQIFVINSTGSGLHQVTEGSTPVWSPSGQRLAFLRWRDGCGDEVWIMRLRTGASRRLLRCR